MDLCLQGSSIGLRSRFQSFQYLLVEISDEHICHDRTWYHNDTEEVWRWQPSNTVGEVAMAGTPISRRRRLANRYDAVATSTRSSSDK
jgi:hypothetical protein